MNSPKFLYLLLVITLSPLQARVTWDSLPVENKIKKRILEGELYVSSVLENMKEDESEQKLTYFITGLHPSPCEMALPRLSLYEKYKDYLGFIHESDYDEKNQLIKLLLGHAILPFKMVLHFKLPRMKSAGLYKFSFKEGFLMGLEGEIHASKTRNQCLIYTKAKWRGPHTGISPSIFSFFSRTLSRMAMDGLFRATRAL